MLLGCNPFGTKVLAQTNQAVKVNPNLIINKLQNNEAYSITVISDGDWHSVESVLIIEKQNDKYIADFIGYYNTDLIEQTKTLTKEDVNAIQIFEFELINIKKSKAKCTTTEKYFLKYKNKESKFLDTECKWNGLDNLIQKLFFAKNKTLQSNYNGWDFLSWELDKKQVEEMLEEKKNEFVRPDGLDANFKYQELNTWLYYDNNNQLNKIRQSNTFSVVNYKNSKMFFYKTLARLTETYGEASNQTINKKDSVQTYIWELKHTRIELEYNYMYKIIDELGAGSYWVEINISPNKLKPDLVLIAEVKDAIFFGEEGHGAIRFSVDTVNKGNFTDKDFSIEFQYFQSYFQGSYKSIQDYINSCEYKEEKKKSNKMYQMKSGDKYILKFNNNNLKNKKAYIKNTDFELIKLVKFKPE